MDLRDLIAGLEIRLIGACVRVCDVTDDSRTVLPGSLFIARRGERSDGRAFIPDALHAGAVAILTDDPRVQLPAGCNASLLLSPDVPAATARIAERFYGNPSARLALIGVTGTNGKTTTTWLIHQLLNAAGLRCGLIGTVAIDDGAGLSPATMTTPPATEFSRTLGLMVDAGCAAAAAEVSSHALDQHRASGLRFAIGIFTNLTGDHLDYHQTMDRYAGAKARLFEMLPPAGLAIVNADDPWAEPIVSRCRARIVRCALGPPRGPGWATARIEHESLAGMRLAFELDGRESGNCAVRLPGRHNAMNMLQALAACRALGVPTASLARAASKASPPPGRLEPVLVPGAAISVYVDYAHTHDALENVLAAVRRLLEPPARLWVVFGCGGDRDRTKRPRMGEAADRLADQVVVTSDNPRSEPPGAIIDEILAGIPSERRPRVHVEPDRARAIRHAIQHAATLDAVLIAGKGHEREQVFKDASGELRSIPFDDVEHARAALAARERTPADDPTAPRR